MKRLLLGLIRFYQVVISPLLGPRCRYIPSCSQYALEAVSYHGAVKGSQLAAKRLCRCHPWGGFGYDPVPVADKCAFDRAAFKPVDTTSVKFTVPFIGH